MNRIDSPHDKRVVSLTMMLTVCFFGGYKKNGKHPKCFCYICEQTKNRIRYSRSNKKRFFCFCSNSIPFVPVFHLRFNLVVVYFFFSLFYPSKMILCQVSNMQQKKQNRKEIKYITNIKLETQSPAQQQQQQQKNANKNQ